MTTEAEFAERCAIAAADLALLYAGQPDEKVTRSLAQLRSSLNRDLAKVFAAGADIPTAVNLFIDAILVRKREIEAAGSVPEFN